MRPLPQKRNPTSSCYIHAAVSVVRQHAAALARLCSPANYRGQSGLMVDRMLARLV